MELFHSSHDPTIERFVPHVPATNPTQPPSVWAIDAAHAPRCWFARDCPRVAVWPRTARERARFEDAFCTAAERLQAIELRWLPTLASTELHRSRFDPSSFRPWAEANGQWISDIVVEPSAVDRLDDLIGLHVSAGIELRAAPNLRPLRDLAVSGGWDFGVVRFQLAAPR